MNLLQLLARGDLVNTELQVCRAILRRSGVEITDLQINEAVEVKNEQGDTCIIHSSGVVVFNADGSYLGRVKL